MLSCKSQDLWRKASKCFVAKLTAESEVSGLSNLLNDSLESFTDTFDSTLPPISTPLTHGFSVVAEVQASAGAAQGLHTPQTGPAPSLSLCAVPGCGSQPPLKEPESTIQKRSSVDAS